MVQFITTKASKQASKQATEAKKHFGWTKVLWPLVQKRCTFSILRRAPTQKSLEFQKNDPNTLMHTLGLRITVVFWPKALSQNCPCWFYWNWFTFFFFRLVEKIVLPTPHCFPVSFVCPITLCVCCAGSIYIHIYIIVIAVFCSRTLSPPKKNMHSKISIYILSWQCWCCSWRCNNGFLYQLRMQS